MEESFRGKITQTIIQRKKNNLLRSLKIIQKRKEGKVFFKGKYLWDFSSNDYLGLSQDERIISALSFAAKEYGVSTPSSPLLSGSLDIREKLQEATAAFKGKERALVFNSGYQANVGVLSSLFSRGDVLFLDKLSHASLIDGSLLSQAKVYRFLHNDMEHLESLLKKERGNFKNAAIVTESIFSMDGDRADLQGLVELKNKYNCLLYVDEAHATGIFGTHGAGLIEEEGLVDEVDIIMGTFSKALGGFGAYLAASSLIIDYLINFCRSFIYSTSLPAVVLAANLKSLEIVKEEGYRRESLLKNACFFRDKLSTKLRFLGKEKKFSVLGDSQIVPLLTADTDFTVKVAELLQDKGYLVFPIRPPTVPEGASRLRFSLNIWHTVEILENLIKDIEDAFAGS